MKKRNTVIIFSTIELVNGNSAGSARMMNYARAISVNSNVLLLSFTRSYKITKKTISEIEPGIYTSGASKKTNKIISKSLYPLLLLYFLFKIKTLLKELKQNSNPQILILYPSKKILIDYLSILLFRNHKNWKIFYEANEVRKYATILEKKPQNIIESSFIYFQKSKYNLTKYIIKYYKGIICISTNIETYFKKYNQNTLIVPILSNVLRDKSSKPKLLDYTEVFQIGFFGSVNYNKENLELLITCVYNWHTETKANFKLDFYGPIDNNTKSKINALITKLQLTHFISYNGQIDQSQVLIEMSNYHLLVLPRGNTLQNKYGFSTKLSEYLLSGVPSLITDVSDNGLYFKDKNNCFIVPPDNPIEFKNKLKYVYENYNAYSEQIFTNSLNTIDVFFNYKNYSQIFNDYLK